MRFVSTAIPFVNASPHLGFALEIVLADAYARHARASGGVAFSSGTDDHSLKNVRAAEAAGVATEVLVDANAKRFVVLGETLGASYDAFVRTSRAPGHRAVVEALWRACVAKGDLEKRTYEGRYCAGCERFFDDVEGSSCPEHETPLEIVREENWFFRLSRYRDRIRDAITSGALRITPRERQNETLALLERGLVDTSVSRPSARARGWGIPVPGDPAQTIYVWFDALANYLTAFGVDAWHRAERRVHLVGKGIGRFHAVLWPAILLAADLPLPTDVWTHGYVTIEGRKIGKSLGNGIDPDEVVARFGRDAVRWFLLRHIGPTNDGDISLARLAAARNSELADGLGNLVARTLTLVARHGSLASPDSPLARGLAERVDEAVERFAVDDALRAIYGVVVEANAHLSRTQPWALAKRLRSPEDEHQLRAILGDVVGALDAIARALAPFLPDTAAAIARALASPEAPPPILFPKTTERT